MRVDNMVAVKMPMVTFVRFGQFKKHKSKILNQILSPQGQHHSFFWHDELRDGSVRPKLIDGLVELAWYLPRKDSSDIFDQQVSFLNVRGDCVNRQKIFALLCHYSTVTCVFTDSLSPEVVKLLMKAPPKQVLVNVVYLKQNEATVVQQFKNLGTNFAIKDKQMVFEPEQRFSEFKASNRLRQNIQTILKAKGFNVYSLKDMEAGARGLGCVVDLDRSSCQRGLSYVKEIYQSIRQENILEAKSKLLPRQGAPWKEWTLLDKEQYRQKERMQQSIEDYINKIKDRKDEIRRRQLHIPMTKALRKFIDALTTLETTERRYFLIWLKIYLDRNSRNQLGQVRKDYSRALHANQNAQKPRLDKMLLAGSLGLEHLFRELGQLYEAFMSVQGVSYNPDTLQKFRQLPEIVAELMLQGQPIEIMDGDVSYMPETWIKAVLNSAQDQIGIPSPLFVISVLGVQSTGKSTLLNTMFNLQFAVSSARCTKGAFMQLLKVPEEARYDLGCDYITVIDTEGLKSPETATLEQSFLHDNELATFTIGMSDATLINVAMQSTVDMQETLQVAVHAFLRMKFVGQSQRCYFVHQNVPDIDALVTGLPGQQNLVKQLDRMTNAAASMEGMQHTYSKFSDILDYNPQEQSVYIPGLWKGSPPMAPPNQGYSDKVFALRSMLMDFLLKVQDKKVLLTFETLSKRLHDLWEAIKFEDFVFSFRNSLAADAYNQLKKTFSDLKWKSTREIDEWKGKKKIQIANSPLPELDNLQKTLQGEAAELVLKATAQAKTKLKEVFEGAETKALMEPYRAEFFIEAERMEAEFRQETFTAVEREVNICKANAEINDIQSTGENIIQRFVRNELNKSKYVKYREARNLTADDLIDEQRRELRQEFENIWKLGSVDVEKLKMSDVNVDNDVERIVRLQFPANTGHITKTLQNKPISQFPKKFQTQRRHLQPKRIHLTRVQSMMVRATTSVKYNRHGAEAVRTSIQMPQPILHNITDDDLYRANTAGREIRDFATSMMGRHVGKSNAYNSFLVQEMFRGVTERLEKLNDVRFQYTTEYKIELALTIAAYVADQMKKTHDNFLKARGPMSKLNDAKEHYYSIFLSRVLQSNQTHIFCNNFLKGAMAENIKESLDCYKLASDIRAMHGQIMQNHMSLQMHVMAELAQADEFTEYVKYIQDYEMYLKNWFRVRAFKFFSQPQGSTSNASRLVQLAEFRLNKLISEVADTLVLSQQRSEGNFNKFLAEFEQIMQMEKELMKINRNDLRRYLMIEVPSVENFVDECLEVLHGSIKDSLMEYIRQLDVNEVLNMLDSPIEDYLFHVILGCGETCPFCGAPCDQHSGENVGDHAVTLHRPRGISGAYWHQTNRLMKEPCPSLIAGKDQFNNDRTGDKWVNYRDYKMKEYYPDWSILPQSEPSVAIYWKWIFARYQQDFAELYGLDEAEIPDKWRKYTKEDVFKDLERLYNTKIHFN